MSSGIQVILDDNPIKADDETKTRIKSCSYCALYDRSVLTYVEHMITSEIIKDKSYIALPLK